MIVMFDGGIRKPSVPAPASDPIAISLEYPRRSSSLSDMRPITCVVAADEPEIAAKIVQPITFTCRRRPGSSPAHGASPWNSERDKRVRNSNSPIRMNSGNASSSCVVKMFQAYCGSSLSSGIERNIASSNVAVSASVRPIQTPHARSANRIAKSATTSMVMESGVRWLARGRSFDGRGLHAVILQRQAEHGLDRARQELERQQQHAKGDDGLRKPQRGVARGRNLAAHIGAEGELRHRRCQEGHEGEARGGRQDFDRALKRSGDVL